MEGYDMNKRLVSLILLTALLLQYIPAKAQTSTDWLEAYRQPGETMITLFQSLKYNGQVYQIHYFTTGDPGITDSYFIARASPDFFRQQHVTALLISSSGKVVTDEDVIEQVLLRYRAAHYLYVEQVEPSFYDPAGVAKEMKRFTNLPVFLQFWERLVLNNLFKTRDEEYAEALRGILSTQLEMPSDLQMAVDESVKRTQRNALIGDAIEAVLVSNEALSNSRRVRRNAKDWQIAFEWWRKTTEQGRSYVELADKRIEFFNALDLYVLGTKLIWITNLQKDRSLELGMFVDHTSGEDAFDTDMLQAYFRVSAEVDNAWLQRGQIILDFAGETGVNLVERLGPEALAKLLVSKKGSILGISRYAWAHAISLVSIGYLVGDFLFGINDTYHNFQIGVRTDEIRQKFQSWRTALIRQTRIQSVPIFDGELANQYRSAYLLEAYASARVYRLYADGVEASARSGIIDPIKKLFGQEYSKAGDGLRQIGMKIETDAEETLGYPSFLDEAQRLSRNRIFLVSLTVDNLSLEFAKEGKADFWNSVSAGYAGQALWTLNESESFVNSGRWELVLKDSGRYLVQAYIPAPTEDLMKPYSTSVKYLVTHAQGKSEIIVNQANKNGKWIDLGIYEFTQQQKAIISLDDQTGEPQGNTLVVFDAVRFIPETRMVELLEGEPFNLEHTWWEYQTQIDDWWEEISTTIEQAVGQWWEEQQEKIQNSFDEWWQEQQDKIQDIFNQWWEDFQRRLTQWFEQQLIEWLNQCLSGVFLPLGALTAVWISRNRKKSIVNKGCSLRSE